MLGHDQHVKSVLNSKDGSIESPVCPFDQLYPQKIHAAYVVGKNAEANQNVVTEKLNLQTRFSPTRVAFRHIPNYAESIRALAGTALLFKNHSALRLPRFSDAYFDRVDTTYPAPSYVFCHVVPLPKLHTLVQKRKERVLSRHVEELAQDVSLQEHAPSLVSFWSNQEFIQPRVRRDVVAIQQMLFELQLRNKASQRNEVLALPENPFDPPPPDHERFLQRLERLLPPV
jgi:hypothetical protein